MGARVQYLEIAVEDIDFVDDQFQFRRSIPDEDIQRIADDIKEIGQQNPVKLRRKGL